MSIEAVLLLATALLAVVAVSAAVVAVRAVRRLDRAPSAAAPASAGAVEPVTPEPAVPTPAPVPIRLVEGRVIVTPTQDQVVATALGRPGARVSIYAAGLAHALRPESRDRIIALMRREYRHRRRVRLRVARRAARTVPAQTLHRDATWLGDPQDEPRSLPRAAGQ